MQRFRDVMDSVSEERIRGHIGILEGVRHPTADPAGLERAASYLRDTLAALGYEPSEQSFEDGGRPFANLIATATGSRYPQKRVLVVAHFDTVAASPGADDNASGVALLLELAQLLRPLRLERTVQFVAVNLEENACEKESGSGTRGSGALARFVREHGWEIEGVLVLESVAYAGPSVSQSAPAGLPLQVPETGDFIAVIGNEASQALVRGFAETVERYGIELPCLCLVVPGNGELFPDTRRSDHAPFWDHGYRAAVVTDTTQFRNPHYHRESDTLETLNLPFAAKVCRASAGVVMELAGLMP